MRLSSNNDIATRCKSVLISVLSACDIHMSNLKVSLVPQKTADKTTLWLVLPFHRSYFRLVRRHVSVFNRAVEWNSLLKLCHREWKDIDFVIRIAWQNRMPTIATLLR